ncbi:MAG TPA: universal stress protein [Streptosporangiaceae bacterium]|nr:universal stress protein [Streptosporangiaceae bacterium]
MTGITVGFDGSHGAQRAVEWALREASVHRAPLTVLAVHPVAASGWTGSPIMLPPDETAVQQARQAADEAVAKASAELGDSGAPSVQVRALSGFPVEELITASANADLIVVGSRGSSPFQRLLLGSVSAAVLHHAHCPVVVVPDSKQATSG